MKREFPIRFCGKNLVSILVLSITFFMAILACSSEGPSTKAPTPITQEPITQEWSGVHLGMCAGDVLKIHPKSETISEPENLGTDANGLIVKWNYPEASLIFAKRQGQDGITCYRVQVIQLTKWE